MSVAAAGFNIRMMVGEQWLPVSLDARPEDTVAGLKTRALAACHIPGDRAEAYEVKFGGALVRDEAATLGQLGVKTGASLVILRRRRRAVR